MSLCRIFKRSFLLLALLFALPHSPCHGATLTEQEQRGKIIYFQGISPVGRPITAYFGKNLLEMPGETATCGSCHGYDGLGRPESGVIPTNITWNYLFKSYGHIHPDSLEHSAFTMESLKSYMRDGVYPGGRQGDPSMPVYDLSNQDLEDLLAFMQRLGTDTEPGLSEDGVRIGMIVPADPQLAPMGEVMGKTVAAYFKKVNEGGGIYGRKIQLSLRTAEHMSPESFAALLKEEHVFAMVSPFLPGLDTYLADVCTEAGVPTVGPFTLFPIEMMALNKYVFYIYPGIREQTAALLEYSATKHPGKKRKLCIIAPTRNELNAIVQAAKERAIVLGWDTVVTESYQAKGFSAGAIVSKVMKKKVDTILFLGDESEGKALLEQAKARSWFPQTLVPGIFAGKGIFGIPKEFRERVFFSYPTLPEDRKEWGITELARVLDREGIPPSHLSAQISAFAAAKVLVEGLRLSGKDLSRDRFIASMEKLYEFETGLTPLVTFTRNRHIGAPGGYIVTVDPEKSDIREAISSKGWITAR